MNEGNLGLVRDAMAGITGRPPAAHAPGPDRYLVVVRMNHELDAVDSFRRNQWRAYWPSYEQLMPTRRVRGGHPVRRVRRVGILPGYVFCAHEPGRDLQQHLETIIGVFDIVRTFSGRPLLIADADIQIIRRIEAGLNTPRAEAPPHDFAVGENVRFVDDLIGRWPPGRIVRLARDGRIGVEVDLMGRKVDIVALPHQIERT
jgi:transcription antitermination factor NusG